MNVRLFYNPTDSRPWVVCAWGKNSAWPNNMGWLHFGLRKNERDAYRLLRQIEGIVDEAYYRRIVKGK